MALGFGGSASSRSIHYMNQAKSAMDKKSAQDFKW